MWINSIMGALLRSRFHGIFDGSLLLLTYTGRKSGKTYTLPVNYFRVGDELLIVSFRSRTWWRNLRSDADGGVPVTVVLGGRERPATGRAIADDEGVAAGLASIIAVRPGNARYYKITLDAANRPDPASLSAAARNRVVVRMRVAEEVRP